MKNKKPTTPTDATEIKTGEVGPIPEPKNVIEQAINKLRESIDRNQA